LSLPQQISCTYTAIPKSAEQARLSNSERGAARPLNLERGAARPLNSERGASSALELRARSKLGSRT